MTPIRGQLVWVIRQEHDVIGAPTRDTGHVERARVIGQDGIRWVVHLLVPGPLAADRPPAADRGQFWSYEERDIYQSRVDAERQLAIVVLAR